MMQLTTGRMTRTLAATIVLALLSACNNHKTTTAEKPVADTSVKSMESEQYAVLVSRFQTFYNNTQTDSVFSLFSDRVKNALPLDKTNEMLNKMHTDLGAMKTYRFSNIDEQFHNYKVEFDKGVLTLVVVLNDEHKMQSFRFVSADPDTVAIHL